MKHLILSMPELYLYFAFVGVLLIAALWTRGADPPAGEPLATAVTTGLAVGEGAVAHRNRDRVPLRGSDWPTYRGQQAFSDLHATLSASYAARWAQAIRRIELG